MPNRFQRQINTVEEVRVLDKGTLLDIKDGSGVLMRAQDEWTNGVVLLSMSPNGNGDWYELGEAMELFAPLYVIWEPPMFAPKEDR